MKRRNILTVVGAALTAGCIQTGPNPAESSPSGGDGRTESASGSATPTDSATPTGTREPSPTGTESPTATPTGSKAATVDLSNRRDHTETVSVRVVDTADGTVLLEETVTVAPPGFRSWDDVVDPGTTVRVGVQVEEGKSVEEKLTITERDDGRKPAGIYIYLEGKYNDPEEIRISRPDL